MKTRLRLGFRIPVFPNTFIAVIYVPQDGVTKIQDAVAVIKGFLEAGGRKDISDRIVCEAS